MDPYSAMAGMAINTIGGVIGGQAQDKAARKALETQRRANAEAQARLEAIGLIPEEAQRIILETPQLVGELTGIPIEDTGLRDIKLDPRYNEAKFAQLAQLTELGETGLGIEDRIAFDQLARQTESGEQARQKGLMQQMAQQGTLDSGASLIQQLQASADATQRQQSRGEALAMQAAQARRDAMGKAANLAGNMEQFDYRKFADTESASDVINKQNVMNFREDAKYNLGQKQRYADKATDVANLQQYDDRNVTRDMFEDKEARAKDINKITTGQANIESQYQKDKGQRRADQWSGAGAEVGGSLTKIMGA